MRVLFLTEEPIRFDGTAVRGGAIHVKNVVSGLRSRGHETFLIDWNSSPTRPHQFSITPHTRFVDGPFRTTTRAINIGRRRGVDVIVSKTRKTYLPGLIAARRLSIPHAVHIGSSLEPPTTSLFDRVDLTSFITRLRLPHSAYLVVCEYIRSQLRERGIDDDKIYNVQNAVDIERFHPDTVPEELDRPFREAIDSLESNLTIGFVGALTQSKGIFDLAEALDIAESDWAVVIAGDGPAREAFERELDHEAAFLGAVPYEQIPAVYSELDTFALPSHTEGLPRVILEAQATATPVVATTVGGIPELVTHEETGLLCPPQNPPRLADALDRLATADSKRDLIGKAGRAVVTKSFSWNDLYGRYERYLADLIDD